MSQESNYVVDLLNRSISPLESTRNEASNKIIELELNSTFLTTLLDIAVSNNDHISKLSLIILKNSICKICSLSKRPETYSSVDYQIVINEIKAKLFHILKVTYDCGNILLSKDFCILVRSLCRHEFPLNWTELYELILGNLESLFNESNDIKLYNVVFLIHHIYKERLSMRLFKDRMLSYKLTEQLFPYISKLWVKQFIEKWKPIETSPELFYSILNELQLKTSVYLDSIMFNIYSNHLKMVHRDPELMEILGNLFTKFKIFSIINRIKYDKTNLIKKNMIRQIKGFGDLVSNKPYSLVFVDFSIFLNEVFDLLVQNGWEDAENETIKLLILIFSSNSMNNEKYASIYFEQVETIPTINSSVTPIQLRDKQKDSNVSNVIYYDSYDKLVSNNKTSNNSEIEDLMDQQLTFCFYKILAVRGGFLSFLNLLREKYLKLDMEFLNEWNEDPFQTVTPTLNMVPELISVMDIKNVNIFNFVFNSIVKCEINDFFGYDTFLQLYTLCFKDFYNLHTYKHFYEILESFSKLMELQTNEFTYLLVFRISRVVNLWCKKPLIPHGTKSVILNYLVQCICSPKSEVIRVQHLVPLYNLYENSKDEYIWPDLFKKFKSDYLIQNLCNIVKVNVPIIRTRGLELICNLCLEYEEDGRNLGTVLTLYGQVHSVDICEAVLNTLMGFLGTLNWVKCYKEDSINSNFILFVISIINSTVQMDRDDLNKISKITGYSLLDELFLSLWLSLLRVLPFRLNQTNLWMKIFCLFGPFLNYFSLSENTEDNLHRKLCLEILTEYVLLLGSYLENNGKYSTEKVGDDVVFKNDFTVFSLVKLYRFCSVSSNEHLQLSISIYQCFGVDGSLANQCLSILNLFFDSLESCISGADGCPHLSILTHLHKSTTVQPMRFKRDQLLTFEKLLPIVNKIVFNTQILGGFIQHKNLGDLEGWVNERLLTLVNVSNLMRNDVFVQFGCILLSCYLISSFPELIYPFLQIKKSNSMTDIFDLGWDRVNIHEGHQGIFVMCYFLRVVSNICADYKPKYLGITNEKVERHQIPPSNRFEYVKNKSVSNSNCLDHNQLFQDSLVIVLRSIVETSRRIPHGYSNLLTAEIENLDSKITEILKNM